MPSARTSECEVVIVGAGPYGLSAAAHLKALGANIRVFGKPMEFWAGGMPAGMLLRSPRVASNISDSAGRFNLEAFEKSAGIPARAPLPVETFVSYGRWFQKQLVPDLDSREVASVNGNGSGFEVMLDDGERFHSQRVVVAAGIGGFRRVPREYASLPPSQVSHCYEGRDLRRFAGKRVAVIGAGQSALECAVLLHEAGASVEVIARIKALRWIGQHAWLHHLGPISALLYSSHDVGPAGISRLVATPHLVRQLPLKLRDRIRTRAVRAAGASWLPSRFHPVKVTTGRSVESARSSGEEAELTLDDGSRRLVDHVLLGTGYSVEIRRYRFLSAGLLERLAIIRGYPRLGAGLSSSVSGLHFLGAPAARTFGPLLYFVAGTDFASRELTSYVARGHEHGRV